MNEGDLMRSREAGTALRGVAGRLGTGALLLSAACGSAADGGSTLTTRDSAGVILVENLRLHRLTRRKGGAAG